MPRFLNVKENRYDKGRLQSYMSCDLSEVNSFEKYFYTDSKLELCESFGLFKYNNELSYITDKITPEGIYYGDRNPAVIGRYIFNYNKDKIKDIEFQFCSNAELAVTQIKAKKKVSDFFRQMCIL
ncbi:MAG: hypothetical protein Q4F95_16230 [Oscillospiraceae bacterium]|nr:hypothetical protein [Oscillospiraceae bacterium]